VDSKRLVVEFLVPLLVLVYDLVALALVFCLDRVLDVASLAASLSLVGSMSLVLVFYLVLVAEFSHHHLLDAVSLEDVLDQQS